MNEFFRESLFAGAALTIAAYEAGLMIRKRYRAAILNPLLLGIAIVMAALKIFHVNYASYLEGAKYISYFLTPATVCLAFPLYRQMKFLKKNFYAAAAGVFFGTLSSLLLVFLTAKMFRLNQQEYVTILPKSITTAIGLEISDELGGTAAVTAAVIILTGIWGGVIGEMVFRRLKIEDPLAKGIALGTSAHAIGTVKAMEMGKEEGAASSFAIAASGLITVVLAPIFAKLI